MSSCCCCCAGAAKPLSSRALFKALSLFFAACEVESTESPYSQLRPQCTPLSSLTLLFLPFSYFLTHINCAPLTWCQPCNRAARDRREARESTVCMNECKKLMQQPDAVALQRCLRLTGSQRDTLLVGSTEREEGRQVVRCTVMTVSWS